MGKSGNSFLGLFIEISFYIGMPMSWRLFWNETFRENLFLEELRTTSLGGSIFRFFCSLLWYIPVLPSYFPNQNLSRIYLDESPEKCLKKKTYSEKIDWKNRSPYIFEIERFEKGPKLAHKSIPKLVLRI